MSFTPTTRALDAQDAPNPKEGFKSGGDMLILEEGTREAGSGIDLVVDDRPEPLLERMGFEFMNIVSSSVLCAGLRSAWSTPTVPPPPPDMPEWFIEEHMKKATSNLKWRAFTRDTAAFVGCSYVMLGVDMGLQTIRGGVKDHWNKAVGGTAAGALLGYIWHPTSPQSRLTFASIGGIIGIFSWQAEKTTERLLLEQQKKLEKDILKKDDAHIRQELNVPYLKRLNAIALQNRVQERMEVLKNEQRQQQGQPTVAGERINPVFANPDGGASSSGASGQMNGSSSSSSSSRPIGGLPDDYGRSGGGSSTDGGSSDAGLSSVPTDGFYIAKDDTSGGASGSSAQGGSGDGPDWRRHRRGAPAGGSLRGLGEKGVGGVDDLQDNMNSAGWLQINEEGVAGANSGANGDRRRR